MDSPTIRAMAGRPHEAPEEMLVFWRVRKEDGVAEAAAWTSSAGVEFRLTADGAFVRARVFEDLEALVDYARRELVSLEDRGWVLMS